MSALAKLKAKREAERKRGAADGPKVVLRSEVLERERREREEAEQRREAERQRRRQGWIEEAEAVLAKSGAGDAPETSVGFIPKKEVVRRLRERAEPATLFGEDDDARRQRLQDIMAREAKASDLADKQGLSLLKELRRKADEEALAVLRRRLEQGVSKEEADAEQRQERDERVRVLEQEQAERRVQLLAIDARSKLDASKPNDALDLEVGSSYVRLFVETVLREWEAQLLRRSLEESASPAGKRETMRFQETVQFLQPLLRELRRNKLAEQLVRGFVRMVFYCLEREYIKASTEYTGIAIGNAQWPLGVTQVGIHSRAGREKIGTGKQAHILNSEEHRKYIQAFKRLLSKTQTLYPTVPSRMCMELGPTGG